MPAMLHEAGLQGLPPETRVGGRLRRRIPSLGGSRLTRRIVGFNLISLGLMLIAVLVFNPARQTLIDQRAQELGVQARMVAAYLDHGTAEGALALMGDGVGIVIRDVQGAVSIQHFPAPARGGIDLPWKSPEPLCIERVAPIAGGGSVELHLPVSDIDAMVAAERQRVLRIFSAALLVSVGLSIALASMIAKPLSDLAAAAESGGKSQQRATRRFAIPDLAARPDEIGRLSSAMRGMVAALYDRIDSNEQFAADVAHEIKNPLASLRSAIDTLRIARDDQRETLMEVIDHDIQRLDRLVTDISNASRLDSELVKEEEEAFDLQRTLGRIAEHMGRQAKGDGVDFVADLPQDAIRIRGLEARLAQVFVNLISNAMSFSDKGDAVRIWARKRDNRVLVVVEDTGPGIPDAALSQIFKRFYSERPAGQFGNHSGLGLAISKQIVEAHGGVIWAENIRPTGAGPDSVPRGARFVVGLPI